MPPLPKELELIIHTDADPFIQAADLARLQMVLRAVRAQPDCGPLATALIDEALGPEDDTTPVLPTPQLMIRPIQEAL